MQKKSIESNKDKLMSKKKLKAEIREKGITLVALVITIIVLLILAGISIATLSGAYINIMRVVQDGHLSTTFW